MTTVVHSPADPPPPRSRSRRRRQQGAVAIACLAVCVAGLLTHVSSASADAGWGVGLQNITTNGFTHQWLGGYLTDVGTAFCIESGRDYPRAVGNVPAYDLPLARGVSAQNRNALAYALWAFGNTRDNTTGAGLAVVVHGLSGDEWSSQDVPSMQVSDPSVQAAANRIDREALERAGWISNPMVNPWRISTTWTHLGGLAWRSHVTVTTFDGHPVARHQVDLTAANVVEGPGVVHAIATDANGSLDAQWTQADRFAPITLDVRTAAPSYYRVWQGPTYDRGTVPQQIITPTGTAYTAHDRAVLPTGQAQLRKVTTNPAYQVATGATYVVVDAETGTPRGTLTVGADGASNTLDLAIGGYTVTETSAPAGVEVDPHGYGIVVNAGETTELALSDPVTAHAGLALVKIDAATHAPLAGATLAVTRDADGDGTFETNVATVVSGAKPLDVDGLTAGNYRVTETAAPEGYGLASPSFQDVTLSWNEVATVTFADRRLPTKRVVPPPTTTPPTTTTSVPPTTSTPPTTVPPTSAMPPSSPTPPNRASSPPPVKISAPTPPSSELPRTGAASRGLGLFGVVLAAVGAALVMATRRNPRPRG